MWRAACKGTVFQWVRVSSVRKNAEIVAAASGQIMVAEISAASSEQSNGVGQVGNAVTQMDESTQQNAAMVEQSAAAAESLKQQALLLVRAVGVFKLAEAEHFRADTIAPTIVRPEPRWSSQTSNVAHGIFVALTQGLRHDFRSAFPR